MSFNANDQKGGGGGDFVEQAALDPSVTYPARIVQLVLMGVQPQRPYNGVAKDPQERLYVGYELSHEFCKDEDGNVQADQPRWLGEDFPFYSLEADRATSTKRYHAIDAAGQYGGDWLKMIAAPCQLTVTKEPRKNGKGDTNYVSNVAGPLAVPNYEQPALVNEPRIFDFYNPDMEVFAKLPKWLQERIKGAVNYPGSALEAKIKEASDGDTTTAAAAPAPAPAPAPAAPAGNAPAAETAPVADAATATQPVAPPAPPAAPAAPPAPPAPPSA
jgi:hypothetical protein